MKNNVAGYRRMFGIRQKDLAKSLNMMPATLSGKENGKRIFSQKEMVRILEIFKDYDPEITLDKIFLPIKLSKR